MKSVGSIGQIAITVSDVESAVSYYRDTLGLIFLFSVGPNLAFLSDGSIRLMLTTPQGAGEVGENSILYFRVEDIWATYEAIVARGSTIEHEPQLAAKLLDHDLWLAFLRDPDGNIIGLMEEKYG